MTIIDNIVHVLPFMSLEVVDISEPVEKITAVFNNINVLVMNSLDNLEFSQLVYGVYYRE